MKIQNPKNIKVYINSMLLNGFKKGQFIEFDQDEDDYKKEVSADGDVSIIAMADKSGTLTIGMKNNSSMGVALYQSLRDQIASDSPIEIFIKDNNLSLNMRTQAYIKKTPKYSSGGDSISDEDFVFLCEKVTREYESNPANLIQKGIASANFVKNQLKEFGKNELLKIAGKFFGA